MDQKFYSCGKCDTIIAFIKDGGDPVICCGEVLKEMIPGTTDASLEKHVPVVTVEGNKVTVVIGSVEHPMTEEHHIEWISLQTKEGNQRKELKPGQAPRACFMICEGDEVVAAFEHCNLHGLWKS